MFEQVLQVNRTSQQSLFYKTGNLVSKSIALFEMNQRNLKHNHI